MVLIYLHHSFPDPTKLFKLLEKLGAKYFCSDLQCPKKYLKYDENFMSYIQNHPLEVFLAKSVLKIYCELMPKCDFNKAALQLYWNHTWIWVFSSKFAAYFQNAFW